MFANQKVAVIIPAAGSGSRLKTSIPKQFMKIQGKPILAMTIEAFENNRYIDEIMIVCSEGFLPYCKEEIINKYEFKKVSQLVAGGKERQDSIWNALKLVGTEMDYVLVHDGARPYVTEAVIQSVLEETLAHGAAIAAVPSKDTVKVLEEGCFRQTLDRSKLYNVQTPQGFKTSLLKESYKQAYDENFYGTDDAMLVERLGEKVYLAQGDYRNFKITTPDDLETLPKANQERIPRIGTGYDVHQLVENRELILGGVTIPFEKGLLGHSDADVLTHAVMDALLGAAALGDLGKHFPDNDLNFKGISSLLLLERVAELLFEEGYEIGNIDCTIIAQRPKLAGFIEEMRANMSGILKVDVNNINIKATTTERLGFSGREEGIAAQASAIIVTR